MFIPYEINNAKYNMDFDENLLKKCESEDIDFALRFYAWDVPSVSLGRNQKILGIDEKFCEENNIPVVRRITGGRALLHDDELTYCIVCKKDLLADGKNVINDYKELSGLLISALKSSGINAEYGEKTKSNIGAGYCMNLSTICDINVDNKKFIGSAQFRGTTHLLQHGAIPYSLNKNLLNKIFLGVVDFDNIITINEITSDFIPQKFMNDLKNEVEKHFSNKDLL